MASASGTPIGAVEWGGAGGVIVTSTGDFYAACYTATNTCQIGQDPWALAGNVFASAGRSSPTPIIGANSSGEILTADGDEFQLTSAGCGVFGARFVQNVFEYVLDYTGHAPQPGEAFILLGSSSGGHVFAVTNLGSVCRRDITGCDPVIWKHAGSLSFGPTPGMRSSWGEIKLRYK